MNTIFDEYAGQVVPIRYHTWWPNYDDCFWQFDSTEVKDRISYYCCAPPWNEYLYVPNFRFDGDWIEDPDVGWYDTFRGIVDSLLTIPSPIRIANFQHYPYLDSIFVNFDLVAEDSVTGTDVRLCLVVTEWRHRCPFPIGPHDHVFRDFVPDPNAIPITIQQGDSLHFELAYYVDPEYRLDRMVTNLWIQKWANKRVHQAYREELPDYSGVDIVDLPLPIAVEPNFPNPFKNETRITYHINRSGSVRLSVYTPTGRHVTDVINEHVGPGTHTVTWDGRDHSGNEMGSGIYYYRLVTGEATLTGKMILLR